MCFFPSTEKQVYRQAEKQQQSSSYSANMDTNREPGLGWQPQKEFTLQKET